ncbi:hypothetical protein nbrc107697_11530 [Gordonia crocea]|uniref:Uncharacterized protein n=2 Tax=Gordonia crocea TaxID=589162 RepID=A0A7I9UV69_9ACTN|nr:hypothetical protein nbrc107697_11530 [Gordonia crocea]
MVRATAVLAVVAGALIGTVGVSPPPWAAADVRVNLPGEVKTLRMGDGTVVTMRRTHERAVVNASLGATPLHRNVWVSGRYQITASREIKQFKVRPGYIVGCQGFFDNIDNALEGGDANFSEFDGIDEAGAGSTIALGPGKAAFFNLTDAERKDDFSTERHEPYFRVKKSDHVKYRYVNAQLGLTGCIGFAQARSWMRLAVETDYATQILDFFGRPFSIG